MSPGTCRLCNGHHAEVNCHQYRTPDERSRRVALLDRCVQCLDFMYRCGWRCHARCLRCDEPHHEALCTQPLAVPYAASFAMPSTSHVFTDAITSNRPTFGTWFDGTTAAVPQRGPREQPNKRKALLPSPAPQKKPKVDALVSQPQPSGEKDSPLADSACAFCERTNHSSVDCRRFITVDQRKSLLKQRLRCFRCLHRGHRTFECCAPLPPCPNCGKSDHDPALCTEPRQKKPLRTKAPSSIAVATARTKQADKDGIAPPSSAKLSPSVAAVANASTDTIAPNSKAVAPALRSSVPAASNNSDGRDPRCVFCDNDTHSSGECTHYRTVAERKSRLVLKARCYRCWRKGHTAYFCRESPITCAKCGRADHHVAVCEDALTKTTIPSKSSSAQPTATAIKSAGTEQRPASSSTRAALEVPAPTPSSVDGRAAKTGNVATATAKDSRSAAKSSPSTTPNAPAPTPSAAPTQAARPTDVTGPVSATTAAASLQVVSSTTNATSSAENRPLHESTASRRPAATSAAKPIEEQLSKDDKTNNGASRQEGFPSEIAVSGRPSCPAETGREALAARETVDSCSASVTSLPANLSTSAESSSSVPDSVTTSDEAPTSVPAGNDHVVLPGPVSDARLTDENNRKATDEKSRDEEAEEPLNPKNSETDFAEDHQETDQMPTTTSDATIDVASSRDGERECDSEACTETVEASAIIDNAEKASEEPPTSPDKGATPGVAESTSNCAPVCTQPADVHALSLPRNDEEPSQLAEPAVPVQPDVDPGPSEGSDFTGCATTTTDSCDKMDDDQAVTVTPQGTDGEAPQLAEQGVAVQAPGPSGDKEFAACATSATDLCDKVNDDAVTPTPQGNNELASQLVEFAVPVYASAAAGPPYDNDFAVCATPTTGPCNKMDVDETETELSRLISELEGAVSGATATIFANVLIDVDATSSSDASGEPPETVVKEENNVQYSSGISAIQNAPEVDERTAWLSQIERILSPSKAESNVLASRVTASSDVVSSTAPASLQTSIALRSAEADDDARMAQEYALQKLAEDLLQLQQAQQAFEAEKAQFGGRKSTFHQECEMLNAMKAAVDAEKEEARRLKQSARDRTMNLKSKEQRLMDKEKKITETEDQLKSKERRLSALENKLHDERRSIDAAKDTLATERADMEKERKSWHDKLLDYDERLKEERKKVEGYWRDVQEKEARCQRQKREVEDEFALLKRKQRDFDDEQRKRSSKYRSRSPHSSSRGSRERSSTDRYQSPSTSKHRSDELKQAEEEMRGLSHQLIAAKYDVEDAHKNLQRMKEQRDDEARRREKAEYEAQTLRRQLEDYTQTLTDRTEALNKAISERSAAIKRAADEDKRWLEQQQQQANVIEKQKMEIEVLRWSIEFRKQRSERKLEEAKTRKQQQQKNIAASGKPSLNLKTTAAKSAYRSVKREVCDDGYEPATSGKTQAIGAGSNAAARSTTVQSPSGSSLASVISSRTRELLARFPHKTVEKYIAFIVTNFGYFKNIQARELTDFLKRTDPDNAELSEAISLIYTSIPSAQ